MTLDQPSWQGASFGMFATYDNRSSRTVTVTVTEPERTYRASLPAALRDDAERLKVVPTDAHAEALAEAALELVRDEGASRVLVEVRRPVIREDESLTLRFETIATGSAGS